MKKLFIFLGLTLCTVILAVAALLFFVDPNQFKPLIIEQTQKHTGMTLVIEGDISWQFFPTIGLSLGKTELKNPTGFKSENLLKIDEIAVDVSVLPLLSHKLVIGNVNLDGAAIYLETRKDGQSNLDQFTKVKSDTSGSSQSKQTSERGSVTEPTENSTAAVNNNSERWDIQLAGISISRALLEIQDDQKGSNTKLYDVGLTVSEFAFDQWSKLTFAAKGSSNQQAFATEGEAEVNIAAGLTDYQIRNLLIDTSFSDPTTKISSAKIALASFGFDQISPVELTVKGEAAELEIDLALSAELQIDKALSKLSLSEMDLNSTLVGESLPQSPMNIAAKSSLSFDLNKQFLAFVLQQLQLNKMQFSGKADVTLAAIPEIRFDLRSPNIDLDEFLGLNQQKKQSGTAKPADASQPKQQANSSAVAPEVEPDLSALNSLDIKGSVAIDKLKANNASMQDVKSRFSVNRGVVDLTTLTAKLYQGSIKASAQLDGRKVPASYWAKKQIAGVQVQPMLKDVADNDQLEGTGNISVDVKGKSLTPTGIKQNLAGTINIDFADGAVNGVNIAQLIRTNYAKFKGKAVEESENEAKKTDFSAMSATLHLSNGLMSTNNLLVQSPLLRIKGNGTVNYLQESADMLLSSSIVGSLEGQGGKDINDLKDITIPVRVSGPWAKPQYKIEFDQLWKQLEKEKKKELEKKAKKALGKELGKLLGEKDQDKSEDVADQLLKGLFN